MFTKCSLCENVVYFNTSKTLENRLSEINVREVNTGIVSGNGLADLQRIRTQLNLPPPVASKSYTGIFKKYRKRRKSKPSVKQNYLSGAFSVMDKPTSIINKSSTETNKNGNISTIVEVNVTFVDENDIPLFRFS